MASGGEDETDQSLLADSSDESSDEEEDEEKLNKSLHDLKISDNFENRDGKWLPHHSWQGEKPDPDLEMKDTVAISASCIPFKTRPVVRDVVKQKTAFRSVANLLESFHLLED